jgi:hypothetical protein
MQRRYTHALKENGKIKDLIPSLFTCATKRFPNNNWILTKTRRRYNRGESRNKRKAFFSLLFYCLLSPDSRLFEVDKTSVKTVWMILSLPGQKSAIDLPVRLTRSQFKINPNIGLSSAQALTGYRSISQVTCSLRFDSVIPNFREARKQNR